MNFSSVVCELLFYKTLRCEAIKMSETNDQSVQSDPPQEARCL